MDLDDTREIAIIEETEIVMNLISIIIVNMIVALRDPDTRTAGDRTVISTAIVKTMNLRPDAGAAARLDLNLIRDNLVEQLYWRDSQCILLRKTLAAPSPFYGISPVIQVPF